MQKEPLSKIALPKIALIGRPNVGKSTLFNRLTGRKLAIVHDRPGITRDRRYGDASLAELKFQLIDTAGLADPDKSDLTQRMLAQTQKAIQEADVLLFMIDAQMPLTPFDKELARELRKHSKPTYVLANKVEGNGFFEGAKDAIKLGFENIAEISSEHGLGLDALYDFLKPHCQDMFDEEIVSDNNENKPLRLAIMGRPNVGKSTLTNALLKEERQLTGDLPGLTRDAIRISWEYNGRPIQLIDTAGIRRMARIDDTVEHLSVQDARKALQFAEVVVLVIDATTPLEKQDLSLAYEIYNEGRAMVIALNKWDLVKDKSTFLKAIEHQLQWQLAQAKNIPFIGISALKEKGLTELMDAVLLMERMWNKRISTAKLNAWLSEAISRHPAPMVNGRRIRPKYMTQAKTRPPTFVLFSSQAEKLPESYERYLVNSLRQAFDIQGTPVRIFIRGGRNPYEGKKKK